MRLYGRFAGSLVFAAIVFAPRAGIAVPNGITIDYPAEGSMFPPDFVSPTFLWRDSDAKAVAWSIEVSFGDGSSPLRVTAKGERMQLGKIDPRCVAPTNRPPALTPEQAAAHTWAPDAAVWDAIKRRSKERDATVVVTGFSDAGAEHPVSRGLVRIRTSADPVGAPIFYRDVPLMPSETEKGVVKPLASNAIPLIAWRVRNVSDASSRVVLTGMHSCANCHSISRDGKTMGMDLDGPRNDKGLYALFKLQPQSTIRDENVVAWSTFRGKLGGKLRVGFMSQVSPTGEYVVTMINDPGPARSEYERRKNPRDLVSNYFVANFKDYRFLQVFYPTRGVLAWYSRSAGKLQALPGADDVRYVHTNAVWSPDGKYLVFARAEAKDAYPPGAKQAEFANDPNEARVQYDLYRVPFNEGKGGHAEPVAGASANGMSNSFPKVSPDGRWIVFVKAKNGQLMRPDSQLYIVPAAGGQARRMRCNTPLMNSWHSFSPNGRWLVFSSKSRSPYTQMFLTHIDEEGNDSPAILIENSTAANRAVNIPEFMNIPANGLVKIDAPVTDYYRLVDVGEEALEKRRYPEAIENLKKALAQNDAEPLVHNSLGLALARSGRPAEAIAHFEKAASLSPDYPDAHNNLASALLATGRPADALPQFQTAIRLNPEYAEAQTNLGSLLLNMDRLDEAIPHLRKAVDYKPDDANAQANLVLGLGRAGKFADALPHAQEAVKLSGGKSPSMLELLAEVYAEQGRFSEAVETMRRALTAATSDAHLAEKVKAKIALYERGRVE